MSNFTKKQLGKWELIFDELIFGIKLPLKESSSWFLGDKHGIIAIFNDDEILYVLGTQNISKTINNIVKGGNIGDFRKMLLGYKGKYTKWLFENPCLWNTKENVPKW